MSNPAPAGAHAASAPLLLRPPDLTDGAPLWQLIQACPPLDLNAPYCYLLLCQHWAETCVVAYDGPQLVGAITAFIPPQRGAVLFVWQVAVAPAWRGLGLAGTMLEHLRERPGLAAIRFLETTVTPGNVASRRLFARHAQRVGAPVEEHPGFGAHHFPAGASRRPHDAEPLLRIGPFPCTMETQQ